MSTVLARRVRGFHALLKMALNDEQRRLPPDERAVASIKKRKLVTKDRIVLQNDHADASTTA